MSNLFDSKFYRTAYPDLINAYHENDHKQLANHFVVYGCHENRLCSLKMFEQVYNNVKLSQVRYIVKTKYGLEFPNIERTLGWVWTNKLAVDCIEIQSFMQPLPHSNFDLSSISIDNKSLKNIYENISAFSQMLRSYKNILFICSDFPGYGGAATNCNELSVFFGKKHNVNTVYWTYDKDEIKHTNIAKGTKNYTVVTQSSLESTLKKLTFKPDLIILKNATHVNLKSIFTCPVIFLIPGIYNNNLDVHHSKLDTHEKQNKYINQSTLIQIRNSTYSFCNSAHTKQILKTWYGLDTEVFYSSFVPFYEKSLETDPNFANRKYEYGLIVSDFTREIKNVKESIEFLKDKKNVILIGKNSEKYKHLGFECIGLISRDEMTSYYKQIKYIVQDSFYESCSNVRIEGLYNGCKIYSNITDYGLNIIDNNVIDNNVIVVSENSPGVGGFGEIAYKTFNYIQSKNKTLLYFNYEKCKETNNIKYFLFDNFTEHYKFMKNITIRNDINNKFKSLPIFKNTIFFVCSPYTLILINKYFPSHKIIYYCGSIKIVTKPSLKDNIFNFSKDDFLINPNIPKIINKKNVSFISTTELSKHYLNLFSNKKSEYTFITLNNYRGSTKKIYDLIYVVSDITRPDKNFNLCLNLFKELPNLKKILIGRHASSINMENLITYEFLPNNQLQDILSKTKICIITSIMDVGPTTFIESIQNNCIPIISKRTGFFKFNNNEYYKYACNLHDKSEWIDNINNILSNYDNLKYDFCYNIYKIIKKSNCNLNKIIKKTNSEINDYSLVIFNENNTSDYLLKLQNNILIQKSKKYQILDLDDENLNSVQIDQTSSNYTILMDESIIIYNWENYIDYKNFDELFFQYCKYSVNIFNVFNSNKKIIIINNDNIKITNTLQLNKLLNYNDINIRNINYIDKCIGIKIKNIPQKADIGIVLIQQSKNNVFEGYLNHIINYFNKSSTIINVYIYYGTSTALGKYTNKNINIKYVNEYDINYEIKNDDIKILYYLYLPLQFINYTKNFEKLIYDKTIKHIVFIAGSSSHMNEYIEKYNIKNIIIKGESVIVNKILNDKNFRVTSIMYKSSIFKLKEYRKSFRRLHNNFIMICRFDLAKNIMFAVKSFSIFIKSNPNHKLYIVGDGVYQKTEIINFINNFKLHNNIILMGWLPHNYLFSFIKDNIDYNISTSITEGIQGTILETMICGIPTICSNIMGNRKIILNNINGLSFELYKYDDCINNYDSTKAQLEIMKHMDKNIQNFINVLNLTVNNEILYKRLSEGCIEFINKNKSDIENINYNKIFESII